MYVGVGIEYVLEVKFKWYIVICCDVFIVFDVGYVFCNFCDV